MKYGFMQSAMWLAYRGSFRRELYRMTDADAAELMERAKKRYREILAPLPDFDREDPFLVNILSAAMLAAVYLELPQKPSLQQVGDYYHHAMNDNAATKLAMKNSGKYTEKAQAKLRRQAEASARLNSENPYTWTFRYEPGKDINSYSAIFTTCGIKRLCETLGIAEIMPALCNYDYDMAELSGSKFTRKYTLAGGGPYCDGLYEKR